MITGSVSAELEALVSVTLFGSNGNARRLKVVVDTGFTDYLTLPMDIIEDLELAFEAPKLAALADDTIVPMESYRAKAEWDGNQRDILVLAAEGCPLLGMSMLHGYDLAIRVVVGGNVRIEPMDA